MKASPTAKRRIRHPEISDCAFPLFESCAPLRHEANEQEELECDVHRERIEAFYDRYGNCLINASYVWTEKVAAPCPSYRSFFLLHSHELPELFEVP